MSKSIFYLSPGNDKYYGYVTSLRKAHLYIALHPGTYSILKIDTTDNSEDSNINKYLVSYKCLDSEVDETKYQLKYLYDITYIIKRGRIVGNPIDIKWTPYIGNMNNYITTDKKWFKTMMNAHFTLDYYDIDYAKEISFKMIQDHIRNGGV